MYNVRLLPKEVADLPDDVPVWDEEFALISTKEPIFETLARNPAIAQAMRIIFELSEKQLS